MECFGKKKTQLCFQIRTNPEEDPLINPFRWWGREVGVIYLPTLVYTTCLASFVQHSNQTCWKRPVEPCLLTLCCFDARNVCVIQSILAARRTADAWREDSVCQTPCGVTTTLTAQTDLTKQTAVSNRLTSFCHEVVQCKLKLEESQCGGG